MIRALLFLFSFITTALALGSTLPRVDLVAGQNTDAPTPSYNTPPANPSPSGASNLTGDFQCGQTMCISAVVNGSMVEYTLIANRRVGWMAMGFGGQMLNTPMVVMWPNGDESFTLSQRRASAYGMPAVDTNPPREATLDLAKSNVNTSTSTLVFTIEANGDTDQQVIYALGAESPSSSSVDATFSQHVDQGTLTLDLIKLSSGNQGNNPGISSESIPLTSQQRVIVAHAVFCTVGFLVVLPAGALLARYFRTFTHTWFKGHWIIQLGFAGPVILIGVILGISAVSQGSNLHFSNVHKRWGLGVFLLYMLQCSLGAFIHFVKPKTRSSRPPQNYVHAVLGIIVIGLAIYQVRSGYSVEWPRATGRGPVHGAVSVIWIVWTVLLPMLYIGGLAFLPKQWRQEQQSRYTTRDRGDSDHLRMVKLEK